MKIYKLIKIYDFMRPVKLKIINLSKITNNEINFDNKKQVP